jgi:hypothetical protein
MKGIPELDSKGGQLVAFAVSKALCEVQMGILSGQH